MGFIFYTKVFLCIILKILDILFLTNLSNFLWSSFENFIYDWILFVFFCSATAKSLQSCPTLCDPKDSSPPGSPVPGILQARTLEWVAISFSSAWSEKWKWSRSVVSDSVWPHRRQPTRLPHPWDSPGKNTEVGSHFHFQCMKWKVKVKSLSHARLFATPWTAAHQVPPSMGFSRQEHWSGVPLPSPICYLGWS